MRRIVRVTTALAALAAAGCVTSRPAPPAPATAAAALPAAAMVEQRTVAYPHGRWQLYGDGTTASPYSWVWIPTDAAPPPAPPAR